MVSSIHKDTTMPPEVVSDLVESKVRFAHVVEQHCILSRQCYSDSEKKSSWYSKEEKKKQKSKHYKTSERMESGQKCKTGTSYRGLEGWTRLGGTRATEQIHACIDAVMDEQVFQWRKDTNDAERIAQASISKTKKIVKEAIKRAKHDEKEAKKAVNSMEEKEMLHDSASFSTTSTVSSSASSLESRRRNQWKEARTPTRRRTSTSRRSSIYLSPQKQSALEVDLIRIKSLSLE
jgi:hypothetical protein